MNWYKMSQSYSYIGNCIDTVDSLRMWDATEMAQVIENSDSYNIKNLFPFIEESMKQRILKNPENFESGRYGTIVWFYDFEPDIHYFFREH